MKLVSIVASFFFFASTAFSQTLQSQFYGVTGGSFAGTVRAVATAGNTLYIGGTFTEVGFPCGNAAFLDATTGDADRFFPKFDDRVFSIVSDNNGGWFVGGQFTHTQGYPIKYLAHINPDHSVDTSFNLSLNSFVNGITVSDSTLYIGGVFTSVLGVTRNHIAAVNINARQLTSWDPNADQSVTAIAVVGNLVYVGGYFSSVGGQVRLVVAALSKTTGLANSFFQSGTGGPSGNSYVASFMQANGKLYMAGSFSIINSITRYCLVAVDPATGTVDNAWNPGNGFSGFSVSGALIAGNTMYVAGGFTNIGGAVRNNLAAIDLATGVATSWNPNPDNTLTSVAMSGNKLVIGGYFTHVGVKAQGYLAMIDTSTGVATSWNPVLDERVYTVFASGNLVFAGGLFSSVNRVNRANLAAIDIPTGKVKSWTANASGGIYALAVSGGKLLVGGTFTGIGPSIVSYLATLDTATGTSLPFISNAGGTVYAIYPFGTRIYIGGAFSSVTGGSRNGLAAYDAASGKLLSWNPTQDFGGGLAFTGLGTHIYVAGFFNTVNGSPRNYVAAFDTTTDQLLPWNPNANQGVQALAAANGLVYLGGDFTTVGGISRKKLAAVDAVTGVPNGFNVAADYTVYTLKVAGNSLFAGGIFNTIGGLPRQTAAIIDLQANAPTAWSPNNVGQYMYSIVLTEQRVYFGGAFASMSYIPSNSVGVFSIPTLTLKKPAYAFFGARNIYVGKVKSGSFKDTTLTISNTGDDTLKVLSFTVGDTSFVPKQKVFSLLPQQTLFDTIRFSPSKVDSIVSVCIITSNSSSSPDTIKLSGVGTPGARLADIHHSRDTINFGTINVGTFKDTIFTISVTGNDTLHVTNIVSTNGKFVVKKFTFQITPSVIFIDSVRFTADSSGTFKAFVITTSDATNKAADTIIVMGTGQKVTSVNREQSIPKEFALSQNYPNPFNPSSVISYQLPLASHVTLKMYDVVGREVATLVDELKEAGSYDVRVDGSRLSSGVYIYRIQAGTFVDVKRMVLMK